MPLTLGAWFHDWSPFVLQISGSFGLRWYGLSYALGCYTAWLIMRAFSKRGLTPLPYQRVTDAIFILIFGVVAGGRLGYVAFYEPSLLWTFSSDIPWWGLLMINRGGMASHGGMLGVLLACFWIARGFKDDTGSRVGAMPVFHLFDLCALAATPGLLLGRLANFINGELLGTIVAAPGEPGPWWSVRFPQERLGDHTPQLTPVQQQAWDDLVARYALPNEAPIETFERMLAIIRGPRGADLAAQVEPFISARHPSQIYQGLAEGVVVGLALLLFWRSPRRPGMIGGWFLVLYGVGRIITEAFWRLPDAHLQVQYIAGLTRGQWLSIAMIGGGVAMMLIALARKDHTLYGGWGVRHAAA
ncbi:MAG: prolipoprotein diacylglyceryl transferase [Phycisphaerales bacterium]|nr:prolipoprotein diacylglyceryl transferase [Phycisphaerales bacterium]